MNRSFDAPFFELAEYETLRKILKENEGIAAADGCVDPQKLHMVYGMSDDFDFKIIVTFSETDFTIRMSCIFRQRI